MVDGQLRADTAAECASFWKSPLLSFVSGHDFSRAIKDGKRIGLQPGFSPYINASIQVRL
jgi:hypothetical protein